MPELTRAPQSKAASLTGVATALLYDSDCRFCRATLGLLLAWDRHHRLRPVALQSEEGSQLLPELTPQQRLEAVRAIPESGIPHAAGAAAPVVLAATHERALEAVALDMLRDHAVDVPADPGALG